MRDGRNGALSEMTEAHLVMALGLYEAMANVFRFPALSALFAKTRLGPLLFATIIGIFTKHIIEEARAGGPRR